VGKANRERRRMKEKARKRPRPASFGTDLRGSDSDAWPGALIEEPGPPSSAEQAAALVEQAAAQALDRGDFPATAQAVSLLAADRGPPGVAPWNARSTAPSGRRSRLRGGTAGSRSTCSASSAGG